MFVLCCFSGDPQKVISVGFLDLAQALKVSEEGVHASTAQEKKGKVRKFVIYINK